MSKNYPEQFGVQEFFSCETGKILEQCHSFNFPVEYLPIFLCIHICTPEHFLTPWYPREQLRSMFNGIDLSSPESAIMSIALWDESPVKEALLHTCSRSTRQTLQELLAEEEIDNNIITQLQNMQLLYFKADFREQMITLYLYFIKPHLPAALPGKN